MSEKFTFIIIGGGIAGVSCVENLAQSCQERILLISSSSIVKSVINFKQLTRNLENFDVSEKSSNELIKQYPNVSIIHQDVTYFNPTLRSVSVADGTSYLYDKLCICTGASPKVIDYNNKFVIGIRDTETVSDFEKRLSKSKRVIIVGNGGIASELVFKIQCCEVVWAIKDSSIISTFIDPGASRFLLPHMLGVAEAGGESLVKRARYTISNDHKTKKLQSSNLGCALGPDWVEILKATGSQKLTSTGYSSDRMVVVEYNVEIIDLLSPEQVKSLCLKISATDGSSEESEWPVYVRLTNDKVYGCDFVVSATGVNPNVIPFVKCAEFKIGQDGGLMVDEHLKTSVKDVFAAGDVCSAGWTHSPFWLQMRLWSQARQMGVYAARCMVADLNGDLQSIPLDFCFELFAHVTKFFNYKVILLGRFNGQGLDDEYRILAKVIEGEQYVKVVMLEGRMVGAILIGETDLEETFENLILDKLDLTRYGDELLEQDIEDYFD